MMSKLISVASLASATEYDATMYGIEESSGETWEAGPNTAERGWRTVIPFGRKISIYPDDMILLERTLYQRVLNSTGTNSLEFGTDKAKYYGYGAVSEESPNIDEDTEYQDYPDPIDITDQEYEVSVSGKTSYSTTSTVEISVKTHGPAYNTTYGGNHDYTYIKVNVATQIYGLYFIMTQSQIFTAGGDDRESAWNAGSPEIFVPE